MGSTAKKAAAKTAAAKPTTTREAWVRFADNGDPVHTVVEVSDDKVLVDRAEWNALAGRLGMSQTSVLPGDPEPVDVEAPLPTPLPLGNQALGAPNRVEGQDDPDEPAMGPGEDPAGFKVDAVNAYLAIADADERARVLAAEAAGENRTGIVDGPHAAPVE